MLSPLRRVVTGHDASGKAIVAMDDTPGNRKFPDERVTSTLIWSTGRAPSDLYDDQDGGARILGTAPPEGGTRFAVLDLLPGNAFHGQHRTDTVDYVICMAGEVDMTLDDETVTLRAGDIMIQRGTNHAWMNRSATPARIAFVLIDAVPKREGSVASMDNAR